MNPFAARADAFVKPQWPVPPFVHALTTTRHLPGNSLPPYDAFNLGLRSGEDEAIVRANRAALERAFALPSAPRWLRQVHGTTVKRFGAIDEGAEIEADAAFASDRGIALAIQTADCLPIALCADDGREIALAHAGWRGLAAGVIEASVREFSTPPERIIAWLGPAIGSASYEVGEDVYSAFVERDADAAQAFVRTRPGHWTCDLYALARRRLRALGLSQVSGGGFDTFTDPRFYSYRRDGACSGRFATLIWASA